MRAAEEEEEVSAEERCTIDMLIKMNSSVQSSTNLDELTKALANAEQAAGGLAADRVALFNNNYTAISSLGELVANTEEMKAFNELLYPPEYGPRSIEREEEKPVDLAGEPRDAVIEEIIKVTRSQPAALRPLMWARFAGGEEIKLTGNSVDMEQDVMERTTWAVRGDSAVDACNEVNGDLNALATALDWHTTVSFGGRLGSGGGSAAARREWMSAFGSE